jgi:hypothetical protein
MGLKMIAMILYDDNFMRWVAGYYQSQFSNIFPADVLSAWEKKKAGVRTSWIGYR